MRATVKVAMRFTHIRLSNWKNFARCEVALANRVFLVGPNASGKSNFLDVFRFLRDLASPGGAAFRRRSGGGRASARFAAWRHDGIRT